MDFTKLECGQEVTYHGKPAKIKVVNYDGSYPLATGVVIEQDGDWIRLTGNQMYALMEES